MIIDVILSHMGSVVTHGYFGAVITGNTKVYGYYIENFTSDPYIIQSDIIIDGKNFSMSEQ